MAEDKNSTMGNKVDHKSDQPCKLSHQFIKQITKDFDEALIIGSGAFGTVYKGVCENGEEMAVKVLKNMSFDKKEFQKEFDNLRRLNHQNVVQLKGFCDESEQVVVEYEMRQVIAEKMHTALCFEFVRNGSLKEHISADGCSGHNWDIQYKIIRGICDGLLYLREGLEFSVWHLDLKPDNILLDKNMIPKIADFGLSRLLGDDNTKKTINKNGTCGYMPPEYINHGLVTKEFDIFSLGVIIVKLMAGHRGYSEIDAMTENRFVNNVHANWRKRLRETLAPRPLEVYCQQVKVCIQIARKCMKPNREERPTIQFIVSNLIETEKQIGKLGQQMNQFRDEKLTLFEEGSQAGNPTYYGESPTALPQNNKANSSGGETNDGKTGTASAERMGLPLQLLKKITNDFSEERKLSTGAFGTSYKGILEDGQLITVKKLGENAPVSRDKSFYNVVQNITTLEHENAVQLVGFCRETHQKVVENNGRYITEDMVESLLCYEYLPKGSLQKNLFEVPNKMGWETRFNIIKGICQGLLFLHSINIVHMDIKPENIMLDNDMRPKIAEFGLSRLFYQEQTRVRTDNVVGSYGYIAPEYLYRGEISTKSDIYSLGLLILETTTIQKNYNREEPSALRFIRNVRENWKDEHIVSQNPHLSGDGLMQIKRCIEIGLDCVEIDRLKRPSIENIVNRLNGRWMDVSDDRLNGPSNDVLSLHPRHIINFAIEPKRSTSSSLYLVNKTDDHIAFRLVTEVPRRYLTELPFCGIVPPKCTYTLTMLMREQKKLAPSNTDDSLTLQSSRSVVHHKDGTSVAEFPDTAGVRAQEVKVAVACEPLAETLSNQIINRRNYQEVLSIDVHSTDPWILTSSRRGYVCIWNYQTQAEVDSIEVTGEAVYSAKFIEREEWFVAGSDDGCIYVYNFNTMKEVETIEEAHDGHCITSLAVNPTHSFVLSASDDCNIKLWDWTNEWQCIRTFEGHNNTVTQVMFNPRNSTSFASASLDHTVKIWNIHSATCNSTFGGHPGSLLCLHYRTWYFQQFLISGSSDGAAKTWDVDTGRCVGTLQGHAKDLSALCWHPELQVLVTGSLDGTVRIWKSTKATYRLENIIVFNLGAVNALGYLKGLTRIVVGCDQGIALMEISVV